jgi:hypothetical protein
VLGKRHHPSFDLYVSSVLGLKLSLNFQSPIFFERSLNFWRVGLKGDAGCEPGSECLARARSPTQRLNMSAYSAECLEVDYLRVEKYPCVSTRLPSHYRQCASLYELETYVIESPRPTSHDVTCGISAHMWQWLSSRADHVTYHVTCFCRAL